MNAVPAAGGILGVNPAEEGQGVPADGQPEMARRIDGFVASTRDVVFLREADRLLIIRPNKIQHLNPTAFEILWPLYHESLPAEELVERLAGRYGRSREELWGDVAGLVESVQAIMREEYGRARRLRPVPFAGGSLKFPVLSEIALTYRCQNRCRFCYASSPYTGHPAAEMSTAEVCRVIEKIRFQAQVPTLSFTGGEPTLRPDLPDLVHYAAQVGLRTNLITNGVRCADAGLVDRLAEAGLKSAQVSLEAPTAERHDLITGRPGSFAATVAGIDHLRRAGIHTHTNTTICLENRDSLKELIRFVQERFGFPYLSMNMVIKTGIALDNANQSLNYTGIGGIVKPLVDYSETRGIRFVWYSPTPFCLFNPVDHGLGSKSCACISGLLSVNPSGEVLPCSSYDRGVGNLLKRPFGEIWNSDAALYYRERRYVPPACRECRLVNLCGGGCPLYWEHAGSFAELEQAVGRKPVVCNLAWRLEKAVRIRSKGIPGLSALAATRQGRSRPEARAAEISTPES